MRMKAGVGDNDFMRFSQTNLQMSKVPLLYTDFDGSRLIFKYDKLCAMNTTEVSTHKSKISVVNAHK